MKKTFVIILLAVGLIGGVFLFWPPQTIEIQNEPSILKDALPRAPERVTLLFTGDVMLGRDIGALMKSQGDPRYPFLKIAETLQSADLTVGNLEGPISARGTKVGSIYSFRFDPDDAISALTFAGFDVLSLANNHMWDYGKLALGDTVMHLESAGMVAVGAGENFDRANMPQIVKVGETSIAFYSFTDLYPKSLEATAEGPGISSFEKNRVARSITTLKESKAADIVAVLFHWGQEYETSSSAYQQEIAHALIDAGADLVVGHHPHVGQEVERYQNGWVAYSLGNFVFDQNFSPDTRKGLLLRVEVEDNEVVGVETIPVRFANTYQPYIAP